MGVYHLKQHSGKSFCVVPCLSEHSFPCSLLTDRSTTRNNHDCDEGSHLCQKGLAEQGLEGVLGQMPTVGVNSCTGGCNKGKL